MKLAKCPKCGSTDIGDRWQGIGRMLQYYCRDCDWKDERRVPEIKTIPTTRLVSVSQFGGFTYTLCDKYGCVLTLSRTYNTEKEAETAMMDDLNRSNKSECLFPCTGILWPTKVMVEGKVFK